MPLIMPTQRAATYESNASGGWATTEGAALASDSVAHTLPATFTEIIASTTYDSDWVEVIFHTNTTVNTRTDSLVNLYIGADSAEQILIPNLLAGWVGGPASGAGMRVYRFPLHVPAGSRISGKHQSVRTATNVYCIVRLFGGGRSDHWTGTQVECVGADTANSRGTSVTAGTTGSLTSIGTSTYEWGFVHPVMGGNVTDTSLAAGVTLAHLGSGAATEILGLSDFAFWSSTSEFMGPADFGGRFCTAPPSTTWYLRAQSAQLTEAQDWCIYGVF